MPDKLTNPGNPRPVTDRFDLFLSAYMFHALVSERLSGVLLQPPPSTATFTMAAVKTPERVYQKLLRAYNGDCSQVLDMLRCSAAYDTIEELKDAFQRMIGSPWVEVLQIKNRFSKFYKDPRGLGYRDLKVVLQLEGITYGYVVEVQLHLKNMLALKSAEGHNAYVTLMDGMGN